MYGGYFSVILQKYGISAVCHGPGYGEEREVTPVGGGIPRPNFYFPKMHMRMLFRTVALAISNSIKDHKKYYNIICDCKMCKEVIDNDFTNFNRYGESIKGRRKDGIAFEYSTPEAKAICVAHFIYNKKSEFELLNTLDIGQIKKFLEEEFHLSKKLFGVNESSHLKIWHDSI